MTQLRQVMACPFETAVQLISGRWKARILWNLREGPVRFGELRRRLRPVSEKMLAQQLRELEADGLVDRTAYGEVPPRVDYRLSAFGRTLEPAFELICAWGTEHRRTIVSALERAA